MRKACLFLIFFTVVFFLQYSKANSSVIDLQAADSLLTIGTIRITGNKITKNKIILREIEFRSGECFPDSVLTRLMVKSQQNLINRSLFNFVTITKTVKNSVADIDVNVVERWYIWPIPVINTAGRNINAWWESKDFGRLNYGIDLRVDNFRGRMERLNFFVQGGFDQVVSAKWTIPYLTKKQYLGIGFGGGYQRNREVIVATVNNKAVFYESQDGYARERGFALVDFTLRPRYNFLHTLSLGFDHYSVQDTVLEINPDYGTSATKLNFFSVSYLYKQDFRDYKPYPLKGYYFDAGVTKQGLGIFTDSIDTWSFSAVFDQYIPIYKRWYFAYSVSGLITSRSQKPYFLTPGFGYLGMEIRGYELYLINGQDFGLFKTNIKFEIIPKTVKRIKWIKTEKFGKVFYALYANLFFDMGYASDQDETGVNPLANQLLWGTGAGIDFVTYYDLVIRFEFTFNKQGENGFFINLVAPI